MRLVGSAGYGDLPPQARDEVHAKTATADYAAGWIDEFVQANASGAEAAMLTDFGDKPLVVLTAGAETDPTHDAAQKKLATLSTDSSHRVVERASHPGSSPTSTTPRPPPRPFSTSSHPSGTTNRWSSDLQAGQCVSIPFPPTCAHADVPASEVRGGSALFAISDDLRAAQRSDGCSSKSRSGKGPSITTSAQ